MTEGPPKIATHDGHPGEHRDCGEVTKETDDYTNRISDIREVKYNYDEDLDQDDAGDVHENDLAMEIVEIRNAQVDSESDDQTEETKTSDGRISSDLDINILIARIITPVF